MKTFFKILLAIIIIGIIVCLVWPNSQAANYFIKAKNKTCELTISGIQKLK